MATFPGGSAWATVRDITQGHVLLTELTLKRFSRPQLESLAQELDRQLRQLRGEQAPTNDADRSRARSQKLLRLQRALTQLRHHLAARR